jgi:leucyl aminopeptidase
MTTRSMSDVLIHLSVNLVVVTPLCENLPGPSANKPGDMWVLAPRLFC